MGSCLISSVRQLNSYVFFITTADSGTLVINILTSQDGDLAPVWQRIFWVVSVSIVTILLLMVGGMGAIQAVLIILGFPFAIIVSVMCAGFIKALIAEKQDMDTDSDSDSEPMQQEVSPAP